MAISTSFKNLDNFSTTMAFEIKHPHNLVVGLHLRSMDVGQHGCIVLHCYNKKKCLLVKQSYIQQPKSHLILGLGGKILLSKLSSHLEMCFPP
jgi:hypothetical protein